MESQAEAQALPRNRVASLDAFRGATIAGMILVNNPGSWTHVYAPLRHAEWHGWTPTDLIFPYFLFIVGVAIPFSFARRLESGGDRAALMAHIARRSAIIFGLGLLMAAFPTFSDWGTIRIMGVLQRIAVVYLIAAPLYLWLGARGRLAVTITLLLGYWALMTLVPVPGFGAGDLSPEGNLGAYLDRTVLGQEHLWNDDPWDPEGLLSTLPSIATTLLGIFTGEWLRRYRSGRAGMRDLMLTATAAIVLGLAWNEVFPINKQIWTSSYTVFTAGTAGLVFGAFYWVIDKRGFRRWAEPFIVYGMNAILVYVGAGLLVKLMLRITVPTGEGEATSLYGWTYQTLFRPWAGDINGSLAFALSHVLLWLGVAWLLHRKKIYLKV
jgi:predicted acyltransferase